MRGALVAACVAASLTVAAHGYLVNPSLLSQLPAYQSQGQCNALYDLLHIQDISSSFEEDVFNLEAQLPDFLADLQERHEGSRFAFASFVDKPIPTAGWYRDGFRHDYCFKLHNAFHEPDDEAFEALQNINVGGGKDWKEGQLEALARAAVAPQLKWRTKEDGRPVLRIAALATDSAPHFPGEARNYIRNYIHKHPDADWETPVDTEIFDIDVSALEKDLNVGCVEWEYPEPADIGRALKAANILPVFLLGPADYPDCDENDGSGRICAWGPFRKLAKETNDDRYLDPVLSMQLMYETLLDDMEMPGIIVMVDKDMNDYTNVMNEALAEAHAIVCGDAPMPSGYNLHKPQLPDGDVPDNAFTKPHPVEKKLAAAAKLNNYSFIIDDKEDSTTSAVSTDVVTRMQTSMKDQMTKQNITLPQAAQDVVDSIIATTATKGDAKVFVNNKIQKGDGILKFTQDGHEDGAADHSVGPAHHGDAKRHHHHHRGHGCSKCDGGCSGGCDGGCNGGCSGGCGCGCRLRRKVKVTVLTGDAVYADDNSGPTSLEYQAGHDGDADYESDE